MATWLEDNLLREDYIKDHNAVSASNRKIKDKFKRLTGISLIDNSVIHHLQDKNNPQYNDWINLLFINEGKNSEYIHKLLHLLKKLEINSKDDFKKLQDYLDNIEIYKYDSNANSARKINFFDTLKVPCPRVNEIENPINED